MHLIRKFGYDILFSNYKTGAVAIRRLASTMHSVDDKNNILRIKWDRQKSNEGLFPIAWLRDNCQCPKCYNKHTFSRRHLMETFNVKTKPKNILTREKEANLEIEWDDGHQSTYLYEWLEKRNFTAAAQTDREKWYRLKRLDWDNSYTIPKFDFNEVVNSKDAMLNFLRNLHTGGLCLIKHAKQTTEVLDEFCKAISYPSVTNYGHFFNVISKPNPSNLAYTSDKLGLHTDLPYYEKPPGIQLLHCISQPTNEIKGGENIFADGIHAAKVLKQRNPKAYELLTTTRVDFYDYGSDFLQSFHLLFRQFVITLDDHGEPIWINYNDQVRDSYLNMPVEKVQDMYEALKDFYNIFMEHKVQYKLEGGDIIVFDNRRVLHGREAYEQTGSSERHLHGCYLEWDEMTSLWRRLEETD